MSSITRFGNLGRVFKEGESDLLNGVARLCVLYEDLRLEFGELRRVYDKPEEERGSVDEYRVMYFLRRALVTLTEFRGGLTRIRQTPEFKQATLSAMDAGHIAKADQYLQQHSPRIAVLRNELGGHVQLPSVKFATAHFSNVIGKVTWNRAPEGFSMGLECGFAGNVVAGAISNKLQAGSDVQAELGVALTIITEGSVHAQAATVALVHAFLWDRFGQ